MEEQEKQFCRQSILLWEQLSSEAERSGESGDSGQGRDAQPCSQVLADLASVSEPCQDAQRGFSITAVTFLIEFYPNVYFYPIPGGLIDHNITSQLSMSSG